MYYRDGPWVLCDAPAHIHDQNKEHQGRRIDPFTAYPIVKAKEKSAYWRSSTGRAIWTQEAPILTSPETVYTIEEEVLKCQYCWLTPPQEFQTKLHFFGVNKKIPRVIGRTEGLLWFIPTAGTHYAHQPPSKAVEDIRRAMEEWEDEERGKKPLPPSMRESK